MSAQEGHPHPPARTHVQARVHQLEHTLRSYGPLTHRGLCRLAHAERWEPADLAAAIDAMLRGGNVRDLAGVIYVIDEQR